MSQTLYFGVGYILMGLLFVALAVPLRNGRVPPNHWYGIRIPAAFESDEAWYRINRHGGTSVVFFGAALACAGVLSVLFLPQRPHPALQAALLFLPPLLLIPMIIHVYRYPRDSRGER